MTHNIAQCASIFGLNCERNIVQQNDCSICIVFWSRKKNLLVRSTHKKNLKCASVESFTKTWITSVWWSHLKENEKLSCVRQRGVHNFCLVQWQQKTKNQQLTSQQAVVKSKVIKFPILSGSQVRVSVLDDYAVIRLCNKIWRFWLIATYWCF